MKNLFKLGLLLLIMGSSFAIGVSQNSWPGFLITVEGDTVSGKIRIVNKTRSSNQIKAFIIKEPDGTERTWETKKVTQYTVDREVVTDQKSSQYFYAKKWPHNGLRVFVHPMLDGKAQLFFLPDPEKIKFKNPNKMVYEGGTEEAQPDTYFISFPNTELIVRLKYENYEVALKQFLRDCPDLTERIGKKKFKFKNLENIITYYNESCVLRP